MGAFGWRSAGTLQLTIPKSALLAGLQLKTLTAMEQNQNFTPLEPVSLHPSKGLPIVAEPKAWVVQLMVAPDEKIAQNIAQSLRTKGFAAYVNRVPNPQKPLYRVLIGPFLLSSEAPAAVVQLKEISNFKPVIIQYNTTDNW